ncbi:MAG TPA: hypothetical protein VGS05_01895 [Candidatus Sulfotelmatobacter sp.]|nr:hypothetical protein [Candidatus Sulfotelmatobacter sp.]
MYGRKGIFAVFVFATMIAAKPASAVCSNAILNGVYGYYHGRPGGGSSIKGVVGQIPADGSGNLSAVTWTLSVNGAISTGPPRAHIRSRKIAQAH